MEVQKIIDFANYKTLLCELHELTKKSYIDNFAILDREISHCKDIYIVRDGEKLVAFFMVNFENINNIETYYLGLSAVAHDYKSKGFGKLLYKTFFKDCLTHEKELNKKILCWWTTATPIAYYWFNMNCKDVEPNLDGRISETGKAYLLQIAQSQYKDIIIDIERPFILRGVAKETEYSIEEKNRVDKAIKELAIPAFEIHTIDETKGDRFLMIGYVH